MILGEHQTCKIHNTKKMLMHRVCVELECNYPRQLLCQICEKEKHSGHDVMELEELIEELNDNKNDQRPIRAIEELSKQVKATRTICDESVTKAIKLLNQCLQETKEGLSHYFAEAEKGVANMSGQYQKKMSSNSVMGDTVNIRNKVGELANELVVRRWTRQHVVRNSQEKFLQLTKLSEQLTTAIKKMSADLVASLDIIYALQNIQANPYPSAEDSRQEIDEKKMSWQPLLTPISNHVGRGRQEFFSHSMRHSDILVVQNVATRARESTQEWVAVFGHTIPSKNPKPYKFGLAVGTRSSHGIYVGLAQEQTVVRNNFIKPNLFGGGHGHYMIDSQGYAYSHTAASTNEKPLPLRLCNFEKLLLAYDSTNMTFKVCCGDLYIQFRVEQASSDNNYRLVVYLKKKGDSVSLLLI